MPITTSNTTVSTQITQIAVGVLGVAPLQFAGALNDFANANGTSGLSSALANSALFTGQYGNLSNSEFATQFMTNLGGSNFAHTAGFTLAHDWIVQQLTNGTMNRAETAQLLVELLPQVSINDSLFGMAAANFANRVAAGEALSQYAISHATSSTATQSFEALNISRGVLSKISNISSSIQDLTVGGTQEMVLNMMANATSNPAVFQAMLPASGEFADLMISLGNASLYDSCSFVNSIIDVAPNVAYVTSLIPSGGTFTSYIQTLPTSVPLSTLATAITNSGGTGSLNTVITAAATVTTITTTTTTIADVTAPSAPTLTLATASDTGTLGDNQTSDTTPTIRVTFTHDGTAYAAIGNDVIKVYDTDGTTVVGTHTITGGEAAAGTADVTLNALSVAAHTLTGKITDGSGNASSASANRVVTITSGNTFTATALGDDFVGLATDDTFVMSTFMASGSTISGGGGADGLTYTDQGATTDLDNVSDVDTITLGDVATSSVTTVQGLVANGATLTVNGASISGTNTLTWNGAAETDGGKFSVTGGAGADVITGGSGVDTLNGAGGDDTFIYGTSALFIPVTGIVDAVADSIVGGDGTGDKIQIAGAISIGATGADTLARVTTVEKLVAATQSTSALTHTITLASDAAMSNFTTIDLSG
ncbi:MAG: hypothetical protein Q8O25_03350, partial [Sulfurisoma sp.]|nr:hypothetical protein [Sulfurisoma sp.]